MLDLSQLDLTYGNFQTTILVPGEHRVHSIRPDSFIGVVGNGTRGSVDLWLEIADDVSIPPEVTSFSRIKASIISQKLHSKKRRVLELSVRDASLHRNFYHFAIATAERIISGGLLPIDAILAELVCFTDMVQEKKLLSIERQIGLLGELLVLKRLIEKIGVSAVDSWHGPDGEPHDFRVGKDEYEVKATLNARRIHSISGVEQLIASKDCTLFVLSVMLGPGAGEGSFTLPSTVEILTVLLKGNSAALLKFEQLLTASDYRDADRNHHSRSYAFRRPLAVIPVDDKFPTVNRIILQSALGPQLATRVDHFRYDVNLEGLEISETSSAFPDHFKP